MRRYRLGPPGPVGARTNVPRPPSASMAPTEARLRHASLTVGGDAAGTATVAVGAGRHGDDDVVEHAASPRRRPRDGAVNRMYGHKRSVVQPSAGTLRSAPSARPHAGGSKRWEASDGQHR